MKPRPVDNGYLTKALELEQRLEALEISKAKCDCKKGECDCKDCPKCGSKMNKMGGCMKMRCSGRMEKAAIENPKPLPKEKITDVNPHLVTESGGQTKTSYYTTNGHNIESVNVPAKKIPKENSKIEQLGSRLNPHEGTGAEREDTAGEKKNLKKSKAEMRERNVPMLCGTCGGSKDSGCKGPMPGTDILACPAFKPL